MNVKLFVLKFNPPTLRLLVTLMSRLIRLPPLITRPFVAVPPVVLQPNPNEMEPREAIVAEVNPVIENWDGVELVAAV